MSDSRLLPAFEPIAVTCRSGFGESLHFGAVVCLAADGSVAFSVGSERTPVFPRSAMKPLQAVAMLQCGLDLPPPQLALVCSSHDGRDYQVCAAQPGTASHLYFIRGWLKSHFVPGGRCCYSQ